MRILVVEDNPDILANVVDYLTIKGFTVDAIHNGRMALGLIAEHPYDLVVLDIGLPGLDGYAVCQQLRQQERSAIPIIMLTARDTLDDRLKGFDCGADDYLVKPFALPELLSRVNAVLKRSQKGYDRRLQVADLTLDLDSHAVTRGDTPIELNQKCFTLLAALMKQSPKVVRQETLATLLWGEDPPESDALKTHIYRLRHQIDKPFAQPLLHTVPCVGYRVTADAD